MKRNRIIAACLACLVFFDVADAAALRTVAVTGQHAADTPDGVTFDSFGYSYFGSIQVFRGPVLNDAGQTAFRANLTGSGVRATNNLGVWSEGPGSLSLVARTGSPAPGGGTFSKRSDVELFMPVLNGAGQTAFVGSLTNGKLGVWSEGSGNLTPVAVDGMHAPGTGAGVNYWFAGLIENFKVNLNWGPLLNNVGQTAFFAGLQDGGANDSNNTGIWSEGVSGLSLVARRGDPAAGTTSDVFYDATHLNTAINDSGQLAFWSHLAGNGVDSTNDGGLWSQGTGALALVARAGAPAPGTPDGVDFGDLFAPITMNNAGKIAFESWLAGDSVDSTNDEGLWSNVSGSLELVARRGSQAAGAPSGVNYDLFSKRSYPLLNDAGQLAFLAGLSGIGVDETNNEAIWLGNTDDLSLVARRGDQAPGLPSGIVFSDLYNPALNRPGQTAFRADLTGPGVDSEVNGRGIWATDSTGALQLVARTGDSVEVAPGDSRTLGDLDFVAISNNSDGRLSGFNNRGQLVFWASFTDGSQGVFVSDAASHLPGDFTGDGVLDISDLNALALAIHSGEHDLIFDLDDSNTVDSLDQRYWVKQLKNTYFGDANLDGEFNSSDLVAVFAASQYEDGVAENSSWRTGDWNGDTEFDTSDLVLAFQDGGYERGPKLAVNLVPEPLGIWPLAIALIALTCRWRSRR